MTTSPNFCEHPGKPVNTSRVAAAYGGHLHNLSVNQLHPVIFAEDASPGHEVVFMDAEEPPRHLQCSQGQYPLVLLCRNVKPSTGC